jgi:preprotein translocase subunit SecA
VETIREAYERKASFEVPEAVRGLERYIILNAIDRLWQEHLYAMDGLREAVYLRAFGQKDPLVEYKNDAYAMFVDLMDTIKGEVLGNLFRSTTNLQAFEQMLANIPQILSRPEMNLSPEPQSAPVEQPAPTKPKFELPLKREIPKAGRNDPCPCGSGKKFKSCCGRTA